MKFNSRSNWLAVAGFAVAALVVASTTTLAAVVKQRVGGRLVAAEDGSRIKGKFTIVAREGRNRFHEKLEVGAKRLDATADSVSGERPVYSVWLLVGDGNETEFGDMRLNRRGEARFVFSSRRSDYPDEVDELRDFGGGTVEIRDEDGDVVADGEIPDFIGLDDENDDGSRTGARIRAKTRLRPPADVTSRAKGHMKALFSNRPGGERERFLVVVKLLESGNYDVVAIDGDTEIELGSLTARTRFGVGALEVDTKDDDEIPGDGEDIRDLSGLDVEVRDGDGNVVLEGRFPDLTTDDDSDNEE